MGTAPGTVADQAMPIDKADHSRKPKSVPPGIAPRRPHCGSETAGTPASPDLLDPAVLRTMPPRVAAFMLYEPREPPPWREEAAGQRETREELEELGGWCG